MTCKIIKFFDKLEDKVRARLSHYPILYALVGGVGIVLFWRGVWHVADDMGLGSWTSIIISLILLLMTGLFVSFLSAIILFFPDLNRKRK